MKDTRYFIVKHNIEALRALPNFIWNSGVPRRRYPKGFRRVREGDRWIAYAYVATTAESPRDERLSLITGFYECTKEARYLRIPRRAQEDAGHMGGGWFIEGRPLRPRMVHPLTVPSINTLLRRRAFGRTTLVPIDKREFERIRNYVSTHIFNPETIPLLGREPDSEQEVLAMVAFAHKDFGIERIMRARTRFPDLLVKLVGKRLPVHLELEVYASSFLNHGHQDLVSRDGTFRDNADKEVGRCPVGVLCWIDDDRFAKKTRVRTRVRDYVQRVFELQDLIRSGDPIRW